MEPFLLAKIGQGEESVLELDYAVKALDIKECKVDRRLDCCTKNK